MYTVTYQGVNITLSCSFSQAPVPRYRVWAAPQLEYGFESALERI